MSPYTLPGPAGQNVHCSCSGQRNGFVMMANGATPLIVRVGFVINKGPSPPARNARSIFRGILDKCNSRESFSFSLCRVSSSFSCNAVNFSILRLIIKTFIYFASSRHNVKKNLSIPMPAPLWKRACAYVIDVLILSVIVFLPLNKLFPTPATEAASFADIMSSINQQMSGKVIIIALLAAILTLLYWSILEYKLGQSIGKMLMKIKVYSATPLTFWQCVLRNVTKVSTLFLFLDTLYMLKSGTQRFFEHLSQTEVIELERVPQPIRRGR